MEIEMLGMNIALEEIKEGESVSPAGIIRPTTVAVGDLRIGVVKSAGPGEIQFGTFVENKVKAGQRVVFDKRMSKEFNKVLILGIRDVLGILPPKKK